jgi:putative chitinase
MSFPLTKEMLSAMINNNPKADEWFEALEEIMPKYEIDTPERIAGFIAQCAHESADFKRLEENLNYSEKALNAVFGRYFGTGKKKRDASEYARNPEMIANYVYQDEYRTKRGAMGNVNDGDGWLFRGRGLKQLTGRNNYTAFGKTVDLTAEEAVEYVATEKGAVESACWFWDTAKLNKIADKGDIVAMTKKINGGTIGLEDRTSRYEKAIAIMGGEVELSAPAPKSDVNLDEVCSIGSRGETVKAIQQHLGLGDDGIYGPGTKRAVKQFQASNGLLADGVAGPTTLRKMFG